MLWRLVLISCVLTAAASCGRQPEQTFEIYHAGSLSVPLGELESLFESQHAGLDVRRHAHGSATAIRQITELGRQADVIASADYRLIDRLMIEAELTWADWNLLFARNAMGIAMAKDAPDLTPDNWADVLSQHDTRVGISNPNQDPCGYRSLMVLALAQEVLGLGPVYDRVVGQNSNLSLGTKNGRIQVRAPSLVEAQPPLFMRPKETDLVALLQSGAIDYLLIYRSVAHQHELPFFELPDDVNLSRVERAETYGKVSVTLSADIPEAAIELDGAPIVYGVSIPTTVRDSALARVFIELLLSQQGAQALSAAGQQPISPPQFSEVSHATPPFLRR